MTRTSHMTAVSTNNVLRQIVRACIPIGLVELYRRKNRHKPIWNGIYAAAGDIPSQGEGFNGTAWTELARSWIEPLLAAHESEGAIPDDGSHRIFLGVAALLARLRGSLRVVDFGGGLGDPYILLIESLRDTSMIDYRVVELPQMCAEGRKVFQKYPGIQFQPSFPPVTFAPDIVYTNGALQFLPDYRKTIATMADYSAPLMLFTELPGGKISTFASAQTNVFGQAAVWFFNIDEIVELVSGRGYILALDSRFEFGDGQTTFPPAHNRQLRNYHTLLFCRSDWLRCMQNAQG